MSKKTNSDRFPGSRRKPGLFLTLMLIFLALVLICLALWVGHILLAQRRYDRLSARVGSAASVSAVPENSQAPASPEPEETEALLPEPDLPQETEPVILEKYRKLHEENPDMVGWLRIDGTRIDYPVMYTPQDPGKYLHTDFSGHYFFGGVPFIDESCTLDSDNLLIFGHNMLDGSMFRSLRKYENRSYWEQHPRITFDTLYAEQEYEVLAAFYDRVYLQTEDTFKFYRFIDAEDAADFDNAIARFREKALYDTGVTAEYGDKLITLVTCAYHVENGRFVVVARRVEAMPST